MGKSQWIVIAKLTPFVTCLLVACAALSIFWWLAIHWPLSISLFVSICLSHSFSSHNPPFVFLSLRSVSLYVGCIGTVYACPLTFSKPIINECIINQEMSTIHSSVSHSLLHSLYLLPFCSLSFFRFFTLWSVCVCVCVLCAMIFLSICSICNGFLTAHFFLPYSLCCCLSLCLHSRNEERERVYIIRVICVAKVVVIVVVALYNQYLYAENVILNG